MNVTKRILEAKEISLFKKLLTVMGDYCVSFPATGVDRLLDAVMAAGKKVLPSDKRAQAILNHVLDQDSCAAAVQCLLNKRFSDLPADIRPIAKIRRRHEVVVWNRGGTIYDKIQGLINWEGGSGSGNWSTVEGDKATLLDTEQPEDE